ncbi:PREDICTED: uncharacterized protein LOC104592869 [Nelumbo nucifera]|uniref:J domain-containing protein n=2 Tax=Nelumbo nucifera TaxID=4432 RepID=A0A822YNQ8_NELNU|nr:PREDICTED: uncharacterized protein LOC104592869 [Nelumbo nucifera]DAD34230.1 TPA_asm: hypothetical protein HUJ06_004870 [Nelumbo nucifera]
MECNKDEATRAKEIAEKKFSAKDIAGARKFALKAQNLYPTLDGLPQMLATLDVYISAANKINGEADWYGILGVDPLADDETVKKQYRKLALMLHPDKNKSIGADGAFKFISEAWSLLSDKTKRTAYDQRRNSKGFQQKNPPPSGAPSSQPGGNGFYNFTGSTTANAKPPKSTNRSGHTTAPASSRPSKPNTFWTACHRCKMQYEYLRIYLNHNLLCPNCHEPFLAIETAPPPSNGSNSSTPWSFSQKSQNSNHHSTNKNTYNSGRNSSGQNVGAGGFAGPDLYNQKNFQWAPFSGTTGVGSSSASASTTAQAASMVQQAYERAKREREEAQAVARREEALRRKNHASKRSGSGLSTAFSNSSSNIASKVERPAKKRRGTDDNIGNSYGTDAANQTGTGNGGAGIGSASGSRHGSFETERVNGVSSVNKPNGVRELSQLELRNMLMEKARLEIRKILNEWSSAAAAKVSDKEKDKEKEKEDSEHAASNGEMRDENVSAKSSDIKKNVQAKKDVPGSGADSNTEALEPMSISVPDPDFHDFDKDRSERSFGENQVWAAYDDDDGMPRYYAMIHNVISLNPFKMRISWLNSKTNSELGPLNWVGCGFSKTCGDFRVGRYEVNDSLNSFSHRVRWAKGLRGSIRIFPKKGDVWAIYRNWSPDWNELTPDEVIHKYDMVEVLDDYEEEHGVAVTPLVKVAGFKTVFHRHLDPGQVKTIPREEMFRFSHQVPSYLLTGQEAPNAPKGCRELDPAATPLELLQVITDVREEEEVEDAGKPKDEKMEFSEENKGKMTVEGNKDKEEERMKNAKEMDDNKMMGNNKEAKEEKMVKNTKVQAAS